MSPTAVSFIAFAVIIGGVFIGAFLRRALPAHHLADDAKDAVRLGTGLIGNKVPFEATAAAEAASAKIEQLSPQTEAQRSLKARPIQVTTDLAQTRLLLFVEPDSSIPMPFLAVLVFWLTIIFASFSLFSRLNPTLVIVLFVFALSASGAIFLVLELSQPFAGLMEISRTPLRNALAPLGS